MESALHFGSLQGPHDRLQRLASVGQARLLVPRQRGKIELAPNKSVRVHWTMKRETLRTPKPTVAPNIRTTT